jgi:hypothetical protein
MHQELFNEPVSTHNPIFIQSVAGALSRGHELVVLKRRANCGGDSVRFLVRKLDEFHDILNHSRAKDAITVFFAGALPIRGLANPDLELRTLAFLKSQQAKGDDDGVVVVRLDAPDMVLGREGMCFLRSPEDIAVWFANHVGDPIIAGELSFWEGNSEKAITAYLPDADGKVRPGAY